MEAFALSGLRLRLQILWAALGPLAGGLLLASFALGLGMAWHLGSLQVQRRALEARLQALAAVGAARHADDAAAPAARLRAFEASLGDRATVTQHLARVFAVARRSGLVLERGEYRLTEDAEGGFARYRIVLPTRGSFLAVQRFSQALLAELPFVGLESLSLQRRSVGDGELQAQVKLVMYLGPPAGAAR